MKSYFSNPFTIHQIVAGVFLIRVSDILLGVYKFGYVAYHTDIAKYQVSVIYVVGVLQVGVQYCGVTFLYCTPLA